MIITKSEQQRMYQATRVLFPLLLIICAAALPTSAQITKMKIYRSEDVGIEFQYPDGWTVKRCGERSGEECLMVEKTSGATYSTGAILVGTFNMNLEGALGENFMFEKVNGAWTMKGKYVSGNAKRITVGGLQGVSAMSDCGVKNIECYTASFLTNGKRTVSFETSGRVSNTIVRDRMLKTLKFF